MKTYENIFEGYKTIIEEKYIISNNSRRENWTLKKVSRYLWTGTCWTCYDEHYFEEYCDSWRYAPNVSVERRVANVCWFDSLPDYCWTDGILNEDDVIIYLKGGELIRSTAGKMNYV